MEDERTRVIVPEQERFEEHDAEKEEQDEKETEIEAQLRKEYEELTVLWTATEAVKDYARENAIPVMDLLSVNALKAFLS